MRNRASRLVVTATLIVSVCAALAVSAQEPPKEGHWKYYPVAHDAPMIPLPSKEELLKVVPPLREAPAFGLEDRRLGIGIWWADASQILYGEQPPREEDLARRTEVRTPAGEDEPLVLGLWGIRDIGPVKVSVKESPFPVTIRRVEWSPRYLPTTHYAYPDFKVEGGREVGFATYMGEDDTGKVMKRTNVVFWMTVEVPSDPTPGSHEIRFGLKTPRNEVELAASVEVVPFTLPRADIAYGMYWRYDGRVHDQRHLKPELLRMYWRDMARHGMTSVSHYMYTASGDWVDTEGNVKPFDGHQSLQMLMDQKADGLIHADVPIMLLSSNLAKFPEAAKIVAEKFKKRGLPELLLYGRDEPPVDDEARASFEAMQPTRKYMRTTTAISDHAATAYADLIDVWTVNGGRITPEIRGLAEEKGATLWTYDCNHRGMGNATRSRFYAGLYTWAFDLKGNFLWCYTEGYSWEGNRGAIHCYVLASDKGPVPSPAWEGVREGIEDYRLLRLLEKRVAEHPDSASAKEAMRWLDEVRGRVDWDLGREMPLSVYPWDGAQVYPMCPDFKPEELAEIRSRVIDYILGMN